jgi:hypothetical protein
MEFDKTTILNHAQVRVLAAGIRRVLGPRIHGLGLASDRLRLTDTIRFTAVAASCLRERERLGLTVKEVATSLKVPQYRIKAVESGIFSEIRSDVLSRYLAFLGLAGWATRWALANPRLARRLGIDSER